MAAVTSTEAIEEYPDDKGPEIAILFVGVSLVLGIISRQILSNTRVPYTVALLILGMGLGALEYGTSHGLGSLGYSIRLWSNIHPNLILFVFLPALLFESSFAMEIHMIKRCMIQMILLAGPGVVISTFALGYLHHSVFPYGWSWSISLLLGGLLSATDPVAVVSLLKELGASKKLGTIIEGESLMNDGTAMVVFELFYQMALGKHFSAGSIVEFLSKVAFGAVTMGLVFGIASVFWVGAIFNDTIMEIVLTFTASYLAFYVAQDEAQVSGVLTVMTLGIFLAAFARTAFKGESQQSMHHFWTIISYIANTLIFILSGVVISENFLRNRDEIQGRDWGFLVILYVFLQLSRALVVIVLYPGLRYYGYGLNWKESAVLIWSGLRGAVALALSLSVHARSDDRIPKNIQDKFVFFTGGVVFLTLIINGSTTQFLLRFLRIEKTNETKKLVMEHVKYEMNRKALEAFDELGEDEELGPADWETIQKYISCLDGFPGEERPTHPHHVSTLNEDDVRSIQLQDTRLRFLNGVQAAYWEMLEEGRITEAAAILLMQSVDEALDKVAKHEELQDWKGLHPHVHYPSYLKSLQSETCYLLPRKMLTYLIVERLELGCYISAGFLRAHVLVRLHLRNFIGQTDISETVIRESEAEAAEAKQFLEDIRLSYPQVLRVVKTKQVVHAILLRLSENVQSLQKAGLLEERETNHLHDSVQADLKKLLRHPPLVSMPKGSTVLNNHPFLKALPSEVQKIMTNGAKEFVKLRGSFLSKERSKADGIWLIGNGIVKWTNEQTGMRHLLHQNFAHGSTLGMFEVITGKPYLCDLVADSVVQCFFVESSKVLLALQSQPNAEEIFWRESALAVVKIILPELFEAVPIPELRAFVENAKTDSFVRGEDIELHPGDVGLLLEGFIKKYGSDEIIGAPWGIIFSDNPSEETDPRPSYRQAFHGKLFHVETRARVVIINYSDVLQRSPFGSSNSHSFFVLPRRSSQHGSFHRSRRRRNSGYLGQRNSTSNSNSDLSNLDAGITPVETTRFSTGSSQMVQGSRKLKRGRANQIWQHPPLQSTTSVADLHAVPETMSQGSKPAIPIPVRALSLLSSSTFPLPPLRLRRHVSTEQSSDGSDAEDEHIVQIESPSSLFHDK